MTKFKIGDIVKQKNLYKDWFGKIDMIRNKDTVPEYVAYWCFDVEEVRLNNRTGCVGYKEQFLELVKRKRNLRL